jgi:uncharacterized protein YbdZ (MbtH family)
MPQQLLPHPATFALKAASGRYGLWPTREKSVPQWDLRVDAASREAACATLLWNDEPNEARLVIAWELAPRFGDLPEPIVRFVKEAVGDSRDPPEFRSDN